MIANCILAAFSRPLLVFYVGSTVFIQFSTDVPMSFAVGINIWKPSISQGLLSSVVWYSVRFIARHRYLVRDIAAKHSEYLV